MRYLDMTFSKQFFPIMLELHRIKSALLHVDIFNL